MRPLADYVLLYVEDDPRSREVLELLMKNVMRLRQYYIFEDSSDFLTRFNELPIRPDVPRASALKRPQGHLEAPCSTNLAAGRDHPQTAP